jgi:hypothetical protein
MARFTKNEMLDELRTIFLYEADHIYLGKGAAFAEQFIGFPVPDADEFLNVDPKRVDLDGFEIAGTFARAYDYAFRPSLLDQFDGSEQQDLNTFINGVPHVGGIFSGGAKHAFMTPDGCCQQVVAAVRARDKLNEGEGEFSIRELALLADMTEGAVRNALADKSDAGLKAIPGSKPVEIDHAEAVRWLQGRRGFCPTPDRPQDDAVIAENFREARTANRFSQLLAHVAWHVFDGLASFSNLVGVSEDKLMPWSDGTFAFDADIAERIALVIGLDVPMFVAKALETSMRRDREAQP